MTKSWALSELQDGPLSLVVNGHETLRFHLAINPGLAFGLGAGLGPTGVIVVQVVVVALLVFTSRRVTSAVGAVALGLITGACLAQISDRLFRDVGGVVDFIEIHWLLPVVNVADLGLAVGTVVLLWRLRSKRSDGPGEILTPRASAFQQAIPVLASLDLDATQRFYRERLGFEPVAQYPDYAVSARDDVTVHFRLTDTAPVPETTSCRVVVSGVDLLYEEMTEAGVVPPYAPLRIQPWGVKEFSVVDGDGNVLSFGEPPMSGPPGPGGPRRRAMPSLLAFPARPASSVASPSDIRGL